MSTTEDALLAAVLADFHADAPRLVYADWLDENGRPELAEFIRVQCELARTQPPPEPVPRACVELDPDPAAEARREQFLQREKELRLANESEWAAPLRPLR